MDYPDHTPYGICTCDACEKNQLQQRVAELGKERDEWRSKHDVACLTITNLQSKYECQLSATSKAMQGVVELTAERDALKQQRDELVAALENCRLLAARHRKEEWATHILRLCAESGVIGSPIRDTDIASVKEK